MTQEKKLAPSRALAATTIYAALSLLKKNNRELSLKEIKQQIPKIVELDQWALARYEKTGAVRWESIFHWYSVDCVKAGFLIKRDGIWFLTPEGEAALKLGPEKLLDKASNAYREWRRTSIHEREKTPVEQPTEEIVSYDDIKQQAREGLEQYINSKNPYEFQDLIAALLRGMGYYTPFVAPKGKDGGVDIIAYKDPLGTGAPRIQVQIKHREAAATAQEVRQLMGLLQKDLNVGIFVSSSGFTPDARTTARTSHIHVELIDLKRFLELWRQFYEKLNDEDKVLLPLEPIYFLAQSELIRS